MWTYVYGIYVDSGRRQYVPGESTTQGLAHCVGCPLPCVLPFALCLRLSQTTGRGCEVGGESIHDLVGALVVFCRCLA